MDAATSKTITFETMRDMVLTTTIIKSEERSTFRWEGKSKDVVTTFLSRRNRSTSNTTKNNGVVRHITIWL